MSRFHLSPLSLFFSRSDFMQVLNMSIVATIEMLINILNRQIRILIWNDLFWRISGFITVPRSMVSLNICNHGSISFHFFIFPLKIYFKVFTFHIVIPAIFQMFSSENFLKKDIKSFYAKSKNDIIFYIHMIWSSAVKV